LEWLVWACLGLTVLVIAAAFVWKKTKSASALPPVYGQVSDFRLTNQLSAPVTLADLRGQVWLADIIFTRCGGPCPQMSRFMAELNGALASESGVRFVSLTADPEYDTPDVLRRYAQDFNGLPERWLFLTGPKKPVYDLAMTGLKLAVQEQTESTNINEMFIHSTLVTLVDKQGRLRGFYPALEPATRDSLVSAVKALVREE
jgi:protein SCO1/2